MSQNQLQSQVLARKWRPRNLSTLVGQVHVVQALRHALQTQRLHHAYLFTGTRGVGKTTLARILAKALNCETGVTDQPCGQCVACQQIDQGRFVDLLEVDAATNTGVDEMRDLLENAMYAPTSGRYKVYVIDEVHMLSKPAFNAMLKTLEEPPPHLLFILATTDPQKIPITVLSRCLQFNLKQMLPEQVVEHLQHVLTQEKIAFDSLALQLIGRAAQGSMRDALSLTDQAIAYSAGKLDYETVAAMLGTVDQRHLYEIVQALADKNGKRLLALVDELSSRSISFAAALQGLAGLLYRLSIAHVVSEAISFDDPERDALHALLPAFTPSELQLLYQVAIHGVRELPLAPEESLGFGMTLLRMLAFLPKTPVSGMPGAAPEKPTGGVAASTHKTSKSPGGLQAVQSILHANSASNAILERSSHTLEGMQSRQVAQVNQVNQVNQVSEATAVCAASAQAITGSLVRVKTERPVIEALGQMLSGLGKRAAAISGTAVAAKPIDMVNGFANDNHFSVSADAVEAVDLFEHLDSEQASEQVLDQSSQLTEATVQSQSDFKTDLGADIKVNFKADPKSDMNLGAVAELDVKLGAKLEQSEQLSVVWPDTLSWPEHVLAMPVTGLARQALERTQWNMVQTHSPSSHVVHLYTPIKAYVTSDYEQRLASVLSDYYGADIQVRIVLGEVSHTAQRLNQVQQDQKQRSAVESIEQDPFVLSLQQQLGAQIVPGSIRSLS